MTVAVLFAFEELIIRCVAIIQEFRSSLFKGLRAWAEPIKSFPYTKLSEYLFFFVVAIK